MSYADTFSRPFDAAQVLLEDGSLASIECFGGVWTYRDISVSMNTADGAVSLCAEETPVCRLVLTWRVELPADARFLGDHWERGYGDFEFRGFARERRMPWYMLVLSGAGNFAVGVKTGCAALCSWQAARDSVSLTLDVQNGGMGVILGGRTLLMAKVVTADSRDENVFTFGRRFCGLLCDKPVMPKAPVYGGNNWYYAYGFSSHEKMLEDSKFIASLAPGGSNRPFMYVDDGWEICQNTNYCGGPWHAGNVRFPDMPRLAEEMTKIGVQPGLWIRPLLNIGYTRKGHMLPRGRFLVEEYGGEFPWLLDPSLSEVTEWIHEDVKRIISWGFASVKHDYTTYDIFGRFGKDMLHGEMTPSGWHFADRSRTTMEIILNLYRTIQDAAGNKPVIGCNTISHAAAGIHAIQRTGDDTSGIEWARTRKMGVNTLAFRTMQHGAFYAADADCVGITDNIPWRLNAQWLDLAAKSGTPLLVSIDPATATAEHKAALMSAFALAAAEQPIAEPLDWLNSQTPCEYLLRGEKTMYSWE